LAAAFDRPDSDRHLLLDGDSYSLALSDMAADGVPMRRLGVLTNITAERRAAEATAMRDLLQVVNHELMNSLTPITSLSQTALDLLPPEGSANIDRVRTALTRVAERSSQLLHFAESYRALAKLPPPRPVPADPRVWLDGAVELTRARWRQVTIATDLEPLPPRLTVDAEQLAQALLNLLANACEAALSGGGPATVAVRVTPLGERCEIAIEDNGPGVPAELEDRIFLPFFTTKAEGSGIGLALARQIVAGHGARLRVDRSATLGGARFSFVL
jgi:signal transduction histidine kinase